MMKIGTTLARVMVMAMLLPVAQVQAEPAVHVTGAVATTFPGAELRNYPQPYFGHFRHFAPRHHAPIDPYPQQPQMQPSHERYFEMHAYSARSWRHPNAFGTRDTD